MYSVTLVAKK